MNDCICRALCDEIFFWLYINCGCFHSSRIKLFQIIRYARMILVKVGWIYEGSRNATHATKGFSFSQASICDWYLMALLWVQKTILILNDWIGGGGDFIFEGAVLPWLWVYPANLYCLLPFILQPLDSIYMIRSYYRSLDSIFI